MALLIQLLLFGVHPEGMELTPKARGWIHPWTPNTRLQAAQLQTDIINPQNGDITKIMTIANPAYYVHTKILCFIGDCSYSIVKFNLSSYAAKI